MKIFKDKYYLIGRCIEYYKRWGFLKLFYKISEKLNDNVEKNYKKMIELESTVDKDIDKTDEYLDGPLVSIVVPVYNTKKEFLSEMIESVISQTYINWELCIVDGGSTEEYIKKVLDGYKVKDSRIKVTFLAKNEGIAENTNRALEVASGDYIGFLDHDDVLDKNALYEVAKRIIESQPDIIYTDEDKMSEDGKLRFEPHFKPDWSPTLLMSYNYICHFFVFNKMLLKKVDKLRSEFNGSQDYDFIIRCTEVAAKIDHVSKVLYHWRVSRSSTAANIKNKRYALEAGAQVLEQTLIRRGLEGVVREGVFMGAYNINYKLKCRVKLTVIINCDDDSCSNIDLTIKHILKEMGQDMKYEFWLIKDKFECININAYDVRVQIAIGNSYTEKVNYSMSKSSGVYTLIINTSNIYTKSGWLKQMYSVLQCKDVHVVGVKWLNKKKHISNVGYSVSKDYKIYSIYSGAKRFYCGYMGRLKIRQNVSAVSPKCMIFKSNLFNDIGYLDSNFIGIETWFDYFIRVKKNRLFIIVDASIEVFEKDASNIRGFYEKFYAKYSDDISQRDCYFPDDIYKAL